MIAIDTTFEIERTPNGWTLWESKPGTGRDGQPIHRPHAGLLRQLVHALEHVIAHRAGDAEDITGVLWAIAAARLDCLMAIEKAGLA